MFEAEAPVCSLGAIFTRCGTDKGSNSDSGICEALLRDWRYEVRQLLGVGTDVRAPLRAIARARRLQDDRWSAGVVCRWP
jgi:hypothetical protein